MSNVRIEFDKNSVAARVHGASDLATFAMAQQALKDSNIYCKWDQEELINSSLVDEDSGIGKASDLNKGELVWDKPYAKKQYYTGNPSPDPNPNASKMWWHKARAIHGEEWENLGQKTMDENL